MLIDSSGRTARLRPAEVGVFMNSRLGTCLIAGFNITRFFNHIRALAFGLTIDKNALGF